VLARDRAFGESRFLCRIAQSLQDEAAGILDAKNIPYVRKTKTIRLLIDKGMVESNAELFKNIAVLVKKSWEGNP
jgi:hypothetical protein